MSQSFIQQVCRDIFQQLVDLLTKEGLDDGGLKQQLIDPLVSYYKRQLMLFYSIITVLLALVVVTNIYIIYRVSWIYPGI